MQIMNLRLFNQQLNTPRFTAAGDVVRWLCAVQSQDYLGALWGVGMRLRESSVQDEIERALESKLIVRSWPIRGTLHFVAPEDIRWMLKYLTPKVITRGASNYRKAGLNARVFSKSGALFEKELSGKQMTREELYGVLERNKIKTSNTRGLHILGYLAQQGLICFGPRRGKQQTLVLLDEWLPPAPMIEREEALSRLALRYTLSHGPVQLEDLAWWAGLTKKESLEALESNRDKLLQNEFQGKKYWMAQDSEIGEVDPIRAFMIPTYDEMGVGYKDRTAMIDRKDEKKIANTIFTSGILINGKVVGTWRRTLEKENVKIETQLLRKLSRKEKESVHQEMLRYAAFVGVKLTVTK
jgi:hypothetical protein